MRRFRSGMAAAWAVAGSVALGAGAILSFAPAIDAAALGLELKSARQEPFGAYVAAGSPVASRDRVLHVVASQFGRARADPDALEALLDEATIAVRAGPTDANAPSASEATMAERRDEAVAALGDAVLAFEPME